MVILEKDFIKFIEKWFKLRIYKYTKNHYAEYILLNSDILMKLNISGVKIFNIFLFTWCNGFEHRSKIISFSLHSNKIYYNYTEINDIEMYRLIENYFKDILREEKLEKILK